MSIESRTIHSPLQRLNQEIQRLSLISASSSSLNPNLTRSQMSSVSSKNEKILFAKRPSGQVTTSSFELVEGPQLNESNLKDGEILVQLTWISVDPYLRGRISAMPEGSDMVSGVVGKVISSKSSKYPVDTRVWWYGNWQRLQVVNVAQAEKASQLSKVLENTPDSTAVGVLGMPGFTAYSGLKFAASFKSGDIVLVSGAAGAVGSLVGQLARQWGAKLIIGTAGGADKCRHVVEKFGFDHCLDYKQFDTIEKVIKEIKRISPEGVDIFFDNTGGHVMSAAYKVLRKFGRVALCGQIANYNDSTESSIPNPFMNCIYTSIRIQGFIQSDYIEHWGEFLKEVGGYLQQGKVKYDETIVQGFENTPQAFVDLFKGANTGKMVVKI